MHLNQWSKPAPRLVEPPPSLDAERWTGIAGATDPNQLLLRLANFIHAAGAADHLDDPNRSRVLGIAPTRWTSFELLPNSPTLNGVLVQLAHVVGFDAAVYRIDDVVILAFAGSGPFLSLAGVNDWMLTNGLNVIIGVVNQAAGPTALSSEAVYQYGLAKLLVKAVQRELAPHQRLYLVGHSLGGGIAALAGGQMSIPTVTFNTASITLAADAAFESEYILNLQIENDMAAIGGRIEGLNVVFPGDGATLASGRSVPADRHDMVIFDYLLEAAAEGRLRFSGYASESSGWIRRADAVYLVRGN
jgi:hypothetical protein